MVSRYGEAGSLTLSRYGEAGSLTLSRCGEAGSLTVPRYGEAGSFGCSRPRGSGSGIRDSGFGFRPSASVRATLSNVEGSRLPGGAA